MAQTTQSKRTAVLTGQNNKKAVLEHGADQVSSRVSIGHGDGDNDDSETVWLTPSFVL